MRFSVTCFTNIDKFSCRTFVVKQALLPSSMSFLTIISPTLTIVCYLLIIVDIASYRTFTVIEALLTGYSSISSCYPCYCYYCFLCYLLYLLNIVSIVSYRTFVVKETFLPRNYSISGYNHHDLWDIHIITLVT